MSEALALLGGTFDPVHYGHLRVADEARQKLNLKTLYLLPAGNPPHRQTPRTTVPQRLEMLHLAQREFPQLKIDDRETRRSGPSYMVDTLLELRAEFPQRPLLLLVGQDAANHLHGWSRWQQLFALTHMVILTRPGAKAEYRQDVAKQIQQLIPEWSQAQVVRALSAHRGVSDLTAATIVAELGELTRFDRARDLMGFVGLVPSLNASGQRHRSGAITKTGNAHVRRVLTEAAWAYRHPARRTAVIRRRLGGNPRRSSNCPGKPRSVSAGAIAG